MQAFMNCTTTRKFELKRVQNTTQMIRNATVNLSKSNNHSNFNPGRKLPMFSQIKDPPMGSFNGLKIFKYLFWSHLERKR